ncbi:type II toxin-antitoxin system RelE/ParE family toxin [Peptococcus simiae]|uniref:type II toxin-antitoxin system RelE/ParE family toxin n=1 Tax=Peptococcus simiae TaxID=1643805 RepID=UPI0039805A7F
MEITFKSKKLEKICRNAHFATKYYGSEMAEKIQQRMGEIEAASSVEMMVRFKIGRCHSLNGNRKNQYAVDLVHPFRLIFIKKGEEIQVAIIQEIVDYH